MAEKITITVRASGAHLDVLTVQDAMRQVLDIFEMLEADDSGVVWKLAYATTNSPFQLQGEAVSFEPAVDVSVIARTQKAVVARGLQEILNGRLPDDWSEGRRASAAKRLFNRNMNGIGATVIDFETGEPVTVTPTVAQTAVRTLQRKPEEALYLLASAKQEIGSIEGTLSDLSTHWNHPAVKVLEARTKAQVWCRLSSELQDRFADKATFSDIWEHKRVIVRGRLKYDDDGGLSYVLASDIEKIEPRAISVEEIADKEFSGGLSVVEYIDRFRDGALG